MSARTLHTVTRTARKRTEADRAYRQALVAARADGHKLRTIGAAAGVTAQAVDYLLRREDRAYRETLASERKDEN